MEHFDLPPAGLVVSLLVLIAVVPLAVFVFMPLAVFRAGFRKHHAAWSGVRELVVRDPFRGSTVIVETTPRVPFAVLVGSLASLYVAVPIVVALPVLCFALLYEGVTGPAATFGIPSVALMAASAVVGRAILRPSRESSCAARIVGISEIVLASAVVSSVIVLSFARDGGAWDALDVDSAGAGVIACAAIACVHAIILFTAAAANDRGNVRACA